MRKAPLDPPARLPIADVQAALPTLLAAPDICSKRWIWQQYDHQVRTNTVAGPGYDAAVIRIKETGTSVAMALDGNGRYCYLSPREGARLAVAEACRNLSTIGAKPLAATNCLNGRSSKLKARGSELFGNLQIPFHVIAPGKTRKGANHEKDSTRFGNSGHDRP